MEVRASSRRRRTASAFFEQGRVVVVVPATLPPRDREQLVERLVERLLARETRARLDDGALARRALLLADRYLDGVRPTSVRWVSNQRARWGSCTPTTGAIRISARLASLPEFVLDAVLLHELAHLVEPGHGARFRRLVTRYPRLAEADAFLRGYSYGLAASHHPEGSEPAASGPGLADRSELDAGCTGGAEPRPPGARPASRRRPAGRRPA